MASLPGGLSSPAVIFHITTRPEWESALPAGSYVAAGYDADGFIHLSTHEQVVRVANARFAGVRDLVLLCVAADRLEAPLRYEPGDPGSLRRATEAALSLTLEPDPAPFDPDAYFDWLLGERG